MEKIDLALLVAPLARKFPRCSRAVKKIARAISPETVIVLDYPVRPRQRWTTDTPHPGLYDIINRRRDAYQVALESFLVFKDRLSTIPASKPQDDFSLTPHWDNGWIPPLDAISLYGFIATRRPSIYMEVGSGNSTKFARRAIDDFGLDTRIISIDPEPRAEIDKLCTHVIRQPIEEIDLSFFDQLSENDIFFVDNSHRSFMNSDVTAVLLDVIPRLKPDVLVQVHDILLPYDYPPDWTERWYSEQYLLAASLLAQGETLEILLPNAFISHDSELMDILSPALDRMNLGGTNIFGYSFWLKTREPRYFETQATGNPA